ncbi:hypothetical protein Arcpr_1753 [Archaeoglobus profundus DSM 5631]|uniref:Transcriptional regulator, CopG/Arc/MetJ family n=2 Tax=Archaeoglobus profundus TaxID=84156 RepID=D2RFA3_ARCPA|nr:hypothetical protein Arcpr_1753 [Archaeoglobus profundus DSM 5631]
MTRSDTKSERKSVQLNITVSPLIYERLKELVELGYFSSVSDAVRYAIHKMIAELEIQGKLPKKGETSFFEEYMRKRGWIKVDEGEID